jgi:hypothetical protein
MAEAPVALLEVVDSPRQSEIKRSIIALATSRRIPIITASLLWSWTSHKSSTSLKFKSSRKISWTCVSLLTRRIVNFKFRHKYSLIA